MLSAHHRRRRRYRFRRRPFTAAFRCLSRGWTSDNQLTTRSGPGGCRRSTQQRLQPGQSPLDLPQVPSLFLPQGPAICLDELADSMHLLLHRRHALSECNPGRSGPCLRRLILFLASLCRADAFERRPHPPRQRPSLQGRDHRPGIEVQCLRRTRASSLAHQLSGSRARPFDHLSQREAVVSSGTAVGRAGLNPFGRSGSGNRPQVSQAGNTGKARKRRVSPNGSPASASGRAWVPPLPVTSGLPTVAGLPPAGPTGSRGTPSTPCPALFPGIQNAPFVHLATGTSPTVKIPGTGRLCSPETPGFAGSGPASAICHCPSASACIPATRLDLAAHGVETGAQRPGQRLHTLLQGVETRPLPAQVRPLPGQHPPLQRLGEGGGQLPGVHAPPQCLAVVAPPPPSPARAPRRGRAATRSAAVRAGAPGSSSRPSGSSLLRFHMFHMPHFPWNGDFGPRVPGTPPVGALFPLV